MRRMTRLVCGVALLLTIGAMLDGWGRSTARADLPATCVPVLSVAGPTVMYKITTTAPAGLGVPWDGVCIDLGGVTAGKNTLVSMPPFGNPPGCPMPVPALTLPVVGAPNVGAQGQFVWVDWGVPPGGKCAALGSTVVVFINTDAAVCPFGVCTNPAGATWIGSSTATSAVTIQLASSVGGVAEPVNGPQPQAMESASGSSTWEWSLAVIAASVAALVIAAGGGGIWYARRGRS